MPNTRSLIEIIDGCKQLKPKHQKELYQKYYGYAMSICLRYAKNEEDAVEILNDSFLKIFNKIITLKLPKAFKGWIRMIIVNTALDFIRKNRKQIEIEISDIENEAVKIDDEEIEIDHDSILKAIQSLPVSLKTVFNLYVIDGYKHKEIGEKLNISESTSRSNLTHANRKLRLILNNNTN